MIQRQKHSVRGSTLSQSKGFTIIELMIATSVFAVVLLLITSGILHIGKAYYKGVAQARTQTVARNVIDEISRGIQFSGGGSSVSPRISAGSDRYGLCVNNVVYEFVLDTRLGSGGGTSPRVLIAHPGPGSCAGFNNGSLTNIVTTPPPVPPGEVNRELLGESMLLLELDVVPTPPSYRITVVVALVADTNLLTGSAPYNAGTLCKGGAGQEFCAVSKLETTIQKRVR